MPTLLWQKVIGEGVCFVVQGPIVKIDGRDRLHRARRRKEADRLTEEIRQLPPGSDKAADLELRKQAAIANILERLLRP